MENRHEHESLISSWNHEGMLVELVEWEPTIWCGKVGYAINNTEEPDVERIAGDAAELFPTVAPCKREAGWEVCLSLNYLSGERLNGVMFGFRTKTADQPEGYDVMQFPGAQYMRIRLCDETFRALNVEPWTGGIPPYEWIGEKIAPCLGYRYSDDPLPIVEYYGFDSMGKTIETCYLYVPVQKTAA